MDNIELRKSIEEHKKMLATLEELKDQLGSLSFNVARVQTELKAWMKELEEKLNG